MGLGFFLYLLRVNYVFKEEIINILISKEELTQRGLFDLEMLEAKISALLSDGKVSHVSIDLSAFEQIYSNTVRELIKINHSLLAAGKKLTVIAPQQKIFDNLCRAGADKRINIVRTQESPKTKELPETIEVLDIEGFPEIEEVLPEIEEVLQEIEEISLIEEIPLEELSKPEPKFTRVSSEIPIEDEYDYDDLEDLENLEDLKRAWKRKSRRKSPLPMIFITFIFIALVSFSTAILTGLISTSELIERFENLFGDNVEYVEEQEFDI